MTKARHLHSQGVSARFIGWAAGAHLFRVPSASHAGHEYLVRARRVAGGLSTECECQAAQRGLPCYHRGIARLAMEPEAAPAYGMAAD